GVFLPPDLHSFPTRRSSDLARPEMRRELRRAGSRFVSSSISVRRVSRLPCRRRATVEHARNRLGRLGRSLDIAELARSFRAAPRSEEHTSELQSRENLVCRL